MKILVIEDERLVAAQLIRLVKELERDAEIFGPLPSVKESISWLSTNPAPDLILADIQLSDGNSLEIFSLENPNCPVIFTTAYNQYAVRAFKVNSIDYLLKPIDKQELEIAFHKFHLLQSKYQDQSYLQEINPVFRNLENSKKFQEIFPVHSGRSTLMIRLAEVAAFIREEIIFLIDQAGKKYITDHRSLDEIEELVDPTLFYRANRQHLVRKLAISEFRTDASFKVQLRLTNGMEIFVSKEKAAEFRQWMSRQ